MAVSERVKRNPASGIRVMFELAKKYENVINLCIGEPDFATPEYIVEAGARALAEGHTKYTSNAGVIELRTAIADKLKKDNGIQYDPEKNIIVTVGACEAIELALLTLIDPGDEVIIPIPSWPNYLGQIMLIDGVAVEVPTYEENKFHITAEAIEKAITPKTKVVIINSPCNPTGAVLSKEELIKIADVVKEHDLMVISDEPYEKIIYDGRQHISMASLPDMKDRVVTINSFSKTYAMTGWRVGYAAASEEVIGYMTRIHENLSSCANSAAQQAAIEALEGDQWEVNAMVSEYKRRRDMLVDGLNKIDGISCIAPEGSFYAFVNVKALGGTSEEIAKSILEKVQVVTTPGSAFGAAGEGYLRISFASSYEALKEAVERIAKYVSMIK